MTEPGLAVSTRSKRAAVLSSAPSRVFDDCDMQKRIRQVRPGSRETMARAELNASNGRRADEARRRALRAHEIAELPTHLESRFSLAAGLLLLVRDRLPAENMCVQRIATDTGEALIGHVLDAEQVVAVGRCQPRRVHHAEDDVRLMEQQPRSAREPRIRFSQHAARQVRPVEAPVRHSQSPHAVERHLGILGLVQTL